MTLLSLVRVVAVSGGLAACGGHTGKMVVDTPITQYKAPDISDITGIDEDDSAATGSATGSGSSTPGK